MGVHAKSPEHKSWGARFNARFNRWFEGLLIAYDRLIGWLLKRPIAVVVGSSAVFLLQSRSSIRYSASRFSPEPTPGNLSSM